MPKRTTAYEMALPARDPATPAYQWLYLALRTEILEGRLGPGSRLPSTRDIGRQYGLARGTVVAAFDQLKSEGYVEGSVGSGTYVSKVLPDDLFTVPEQLRTRPRAGEPRRALSRFAGRVRGFPGLAATRPRAFRANLPAIDLFPTTIWAKVAARRLRRVTASQLMGCGPMGYEPLRKAIAEYLTSSRGVTCESGQIAVVSGVQEALDVAARLLLDPGDRVCMEEPGFPGAARVFEAAGAEIAAVPLDEEGIDVRDPRFDSARLVYVTPAHQFPLGVTMSLPRRLELLRRARAAGAMVFEDDYDGEYRYSGRPVPALQGLDRDGAVLFAGSFSKVLFPSLRLGYLVVPPDLVDLVESTISVSTRHAPVLEQAALRDFITEGHFGRHLRRMREVYAERLSVLLEAARSDLAGLLEISTVEAGLQTIGWLADGIWGEDAERAAEAHGVDVTSIGQYGREPLVREGLQLGFAAVDTDEIRRGVAALAAALEPLGRRRQKSGRDDRGPGIRSLGPRASRPPFS